jgi:hypothetical protein
MSFAAKKHAMFLTPCFNDTCPKHTFCDGVYVDVLRQTCLQHMLCIRLLVSRALHEGMMHPQVTSLVDAAATASRVRAMGMLTAEADVGEGDKEELPGFEMGMRLLDEMQRAGLQPDAITYTVNSALPWRIRAACVATCCVNIRLSAGKLVYGLFMRRQYLPRNVPELVAHDHCWSDKARDMVRCSLSRRSSMQPSKKALCALCLRLESSSGKNRHNMCARDSWCLAAQHLLHHKKTAQHSLSAPGTSA